MNLEWGLLEVLVGRPTVSSKWLFARCQQPVRNVPEAPDHDAALLETSSKPVMSPMIYASKLKHP